MNYRAFCLFGLLCLIQFGCVQRMSDEAAHPLIGKKAPLFTGTLLDESVFDLGEHLGQDVIILDFWATWCGPCREALPTLAKVASEYHDRGVAFYAVDMGETAAEVQAYLDQSSLPLTVVMDSDGSVADAYGVEAIPQTVIIDRRGNVRFVHVGVSGDLRQRLTSELDELVAESGSVENAAPMARVNGVPKYSQWR